MTDAPNTTGSAALVKATVWAETRRKAFRLSRDRAAAFVRWAKARHPGMRSMAAWDQLYADYLNRPVR